MRADVVRGVGCLAMLIQSLVAHTITCTPVCPRVLEPVAFIGKPLHGELGGSGRGQFQIVEAIAGLAKELRTVLVVSDCDLEFEPERDYLVLADAVRDGRIRVGCSGLRPRDEASDDLRILRARVRGTPVQELRGRIEENVDDHGDEVARAAGRHPLAGVAIEAKRDGRVFRATTDAEGAFRIEVPEPGQYMVKASYPVHSTRETEYPFRVEPSSYAEYFIGMWNNGQIMGTVRDTDGNPMSDVSVDLELLQASGQDEDADADFDHYAYTDQNGAYTFEHVPAGVYVVGVNTHGAVAHFPYDTRYFPGVDSRGEAAPVRVEGPGTRADVDIVLGRRLPTREVRVHVKLQDGQVVANADVKCFGAAETQQGLHDQYFSRTDEHGEATCELLEDHEYQIAAGLVRSDDGLSNVSLENAGRRPWPLVPANDRAGLVQITVERVRIVP